MSLALHYGATINATIDASINPAVNCQGASGVLVHILTTSSLTITGQVALDGGASSPDYSTVPITNHKTGAVTAAGTAITVSQDDLYYVPVNGASKFQLVRGAGSGTVSMQPVFAVSGAGSGSSTGPLGIGKAEDAAHASGDVGVMSLGVRNDADAALSGTDLDYTPIATDAKGAVKTINPLTIVAVTFSPPAATLAANDIIADTQEIAGAVRTNAGYAVLDTIIIDDEDDQGVAMDIVFFSANTSLGSEDSAVSISDANSRTILGIVSVSNSDFIDLTANRTATLRNVGLTVQGATGSTSIYAGLVTRGTPTYTTAGITARFGFKQA